MRSVPANGLPRDSEAPLRLATRAVHAGERRERPDFTPTATPIYASASFSYDDTAALDAVFGNERPGYVYTRYGNPTTRALEIAVADLEGAEDAVAYASGMAAVYGAIMHGVAAGTRVVAAHDVYGASYEIFRRLLSSFGVETTFVDPLDLAAVERAVSEIRPRLLFCETISNPLLRVPDLPALAEIAHRAGARLIVDNTFATPLLVNPLRHGADVVIHSATKYLGGHGDVTGGVVATDAFTAAELREDLKLTGPVLGPFESWLVLRGIKTLPLRFERQCASAAAIASWLATHPVVTGVNYPGQAALAGAKRIFNGPARGAMVSFEIAGAGQPAVFRFLETLRLCVPATTLGDVYSLVLCPAISSHRALSAKERARVGIGDGLVRLSVGIEDVEDIKADLDQALHAAVAAEAAPLTAAPAGS